MIPHGYRKIPYVYRQGKKKQKRVQNSFKMQKILSKYTLFWKKKLKKNLRIFFGENISPHLDSAFNLSVVFQTNCFTLYIAIFRQ
jgi:hypothetical protein